MNRTLRKLSVTLSVLLILVLILLPAAAFADEPVTPADQEDFSGEAPSQEGTDVITLDFYENDDTEGMIAEYTDQLNGQDVRLDVTGLSSDVYPFLAAFSFAGLDLKYTDVYTDFYWDETRLADIPGLHTLTVTDAYADSFSREDVFEELTTLTLVNNSHSCKLFGNLTTRQMPALTRLILDFADEASFSGVMTSQNRYQLPSTLQDVELRIDGKPLSADEMGKLLTADETDETLTDPEPLSIFLGILLQCCPSARLNDVPVMELPGKLADTADVALIREAITDSYICGVYDEVCYESQDFSYAEPVPVYGKLIFAEFDEYSGLTSTSADPEPDSSGYRDGMVDDALLASGLEDADTLILIYDKNTSVGFYTFGGSAYQVDTIAVIKDLNTDILYAPITVVSNDPPSTITVNTINGVPVGGSGYGDYEPEKAVEMAISRYDSSIPGKADRPAEETPAPEEATDPSAADTPAAEGTEPAADAGTAQLPAADPAFLDQVLAALNNPVYNDTLTALQGGETIGYAAVSKAASGLQQTLVDFGCDIAVDGSAGPGTFNALNSVLAAFGKEPAETVDAALYSELLPLMLLGMDEAGEYDDLLRNHYETAGETGQFEYLKGCAYFAQERYYHAMEAFQNSSYKDYEERAAACVQPWPSNGELWHNSAVYGSDMILSFQVNSFDESEGMCFEVYTQDGDLASVLFITGSGSVSTYLPGGTYKIKDATGDNWYGLKDAFGRYGSYEFMSFYEVEGDQYLTALDSGYEWTITINVTEGNPDATGVGAVDSDWETWSAR